MNNLTPEDRVKLGKDLAELRRAASALRREINEMREDLGASPMRTTSQREMSALVD